MEVTIDPDEHFLHQVLCLFAIADGPVYEVQQAGLIASDELREGALLSTEECSDDG